MATHKLEPDASMPRFRKLSAFFGKRCLADQTEDFPSSKASHKQLRKRSNRDGTPLADPSTFTSQLSIFKLLSRPLSKRDPSVGYGVQNLTAETPEERVQAAGHNSREASSCTVSVVYAAPSKESSFWEAEVSQNLPEQIFMAQHLQSPKDEVTELGSAQSAQEPLDTYKTVVVSEPLLSEDEERGDQKVAVGPGQACPQELGESQDGTLASKLHAFGSSAPNQDRAVDESSSASECTSKAAKAQSSTLIDQQHQAQPHTEHHFSLAQQSSQAQERSQSVLHILGTCEELCSVTTSYEELQSLLCATLPQSAANKTDHGAGRSDADTVQVDAVEHGQGCRNDKSLLTYQQNKQGQKFEGDVRRSSRIKTLFIKVEDNVTDCHKNKQGASKLVVSGSLYGNIPKSTQSDFFLPASKRSKKQKLVEGTHTGVSDKPVLREKRPREEKAVLAQKGSAGISSKQAPSNDDFFKPATKRQKQILNTKSDRSLDSPTKEEKGERTSVLEFDLWTEAKIAAEENAQLCAGKPTHPFFSQHKGGQRVSISIGLPANACSSQLVSTFEEMELIPSPPFHITQLPEAEENTTYMESWTCSRICQNLKMDPAMSRRECLNKSGKELDTLLRIPVVNKQSKTPSHRRDYSSGRLPFDNSLEPLLTFLKDFDCNSKETMNQDNTEFSSAYLEDRLKLCLSDRAKRFSEVLTEMPSACTDDQKNLLWADVYQPQSPQQVCGNRDSVNILSSWLEKWQAGSSFMIGPAERDSTCRKMSSNEGSDEDGGCFQEDCDSEDDTKEDALSQSVLLLTGPVGCGKTAAIYACARAHGFTVLEVNCSDNRNGLLIKQKFSESMESHRLGKWSADTTGPGIGAFCSTRDADTVVADNMEHASNQKRQKQKQKQAVNARTSTSKLLNSKAVVYTDGGPVLQAEQQDTTGPGIDPFCSTRDANTNVADNMEHVSNQKRRKPKQKQAVNARTSTSKLLNSKAVVNTDGGPVLQAEQQDGSKESDKSLTVLLFEDVDMVFEDDRGFIAAVAQVAATAKRPIILTTNDKRLCLPHRLGADLLEFEKPSTKELVVLTYLICVAEGIHCRPEILLHMVKLCHHDLRLLLNYLQFWSQGHISECSRELEGMKPLAKSEKLIEMQSASKSQEADSATTTKLFELEAQHRLWPSYVALEFPCSATQAVACELNKKVFQVERECDLEEEKKLQHLILEKLALIKKLKRQKVDTPLRAERESMSNDSKELAVEESDNWETPVKNLKDAKAVARSPILREKLKKDLATTMFGSAATEENLDENNQTSSTRECGEDSLSNLSVGEDVLGGAEVSITPSPLRTVKTGTYPSLQTCEDEVPLTNDVDAETESMRNNVLTKASSQTLTSNVQPREKFRRNPEESKLQKVSESINTLWSEFRETKEKQGLLLSSTCKESLATTLYLSELLENLSICDIMSCSFGTEEMVLDNILYPSSCCESLENSNLLQACSMVAHKSFLLCMEHCWASPNIQGEAKVELSIEDMMLAVNDPCALGKSVTTDVLLHSSRMLKLLNIAPSSQEQEFIRNERKSSLHRALYNELPSKAQASLQRASFFEDASFLARIGLLEQERISSGGTRRRGRGFQNYFRIHPWNMSKEGISIIEQFGKFGRACSADL